METNKIITETILVSGVEVQLEKLETTPEPVIRPKIVETKEQIARTRANAIKTIAIQQAIVDKCDAKLALFN